MINERGDSKNLLIIFTVVVSVFLVGLITLNFLVLKPKKDEILAKKNTGIININERPVKRLDTDIFNNEKFLQLQISKAISSDIETIETGKRNIFTASE